MHNTVHKNVLAHVLKLFVEFLVAFFVFFALLHDDYQDIMDVQMLRFLCLESVRVAPCLSLSSAAFSPCFISTL